jgi:dTDP-glucose 4,6-dehydratase/UDP-glucose 4-epimerase
VFSAYGIGQKKLLFWDLYKKFISYPNHKFLKLFGTGHESRDFIYIDDIAQQIDLIVNNAVFKGEVYNVANGIEVSIQEVALTMRDFLQSDKEIVFQDINRLGDPMNWCADISNLINWGYCQSVSLRQGIELYCEWIRTLTDD